MGYMVKNCIWTLFLGALHLRLIMLFHLVVDIAGGKEAEGV